MTKLIIEAKTKEDIISALGIIQGHLERGYYTGIDDDYSWDMED
jgi:hypothetical protein